MRLESEEDCIAELQRSNRRGIPEHIFPGLARYLVHGIGPGSFLQAMLTNDLRGVMNNADDQNRAHLPEIWEFFYNHIPSAAWGSESNFLKWIEERQK